MAGLAWGIPCHFWRLPKRMRTKATVCCCVIALSCLCGWLCQLCCTCIRRSLVAMHSYDGVTPHHRGPQPHQQLTSFRVHTVAEYPGDVARLVRHNPIKVGLWVVGLLVYFLATGSPSSEQELAAYSSELPHDEEYNTLFKFEHAANEARAAWSDSTRWFGWVCDGECPQLKEKFEVAVAAAATAKAEVDAKIATAKRQLPLLSSEGIGAVRERWDEIWSGGKKTAGKLTKQSARWNTLSLLFAGGDRDRTAEILMRFVVEVVMWCVATLTYSLFAFFVGAWNICWSYKGSIVTAVLVWLLASLAVAAYVATLVASVVVVGNVALRATLGSPPPRLEDGGRTNSERARSLKSS